MYHGFGSDNGHFPQIQGCPAIPLEARKRIGKGVAQGPGSSDFSHISVIYLEASKGERHKTALIWEMRFPLASLKLGQGSWWEPARTGIWVLPSVACFLSGPLQQRGRRHRTLIDTVCAVDSTARRPFRGQTEVPTTATADADPGWACSRARPLQLSPPASACA